MSGLEPNHDTTQVVGGASGFRQRETCRVPNRASLLGYRRGFQDCAYGLSHLATTTSLMEARVTTATRRLRRASVAGLATVATAQPVVAARATAPGLVPRAPRSRHPAPSTVFPGQSCAGARRASAWPSSTAPGSPATSSPFELCFDLASDDRDLRHAQTASRARRSRPPRPLQRRTVAAPHVTARASVPVGRSRSRRSTTSSHCRSADACGVAGVTDPDHRDLT